MSSLVAEEMAASNWTWQDASPVETVETVETVNPQWTWQDTSVLRKTIPPRAITLRLPPARLHELDIRDLRAASQKRAPPSSGVPPIVEQLQAAVRANAAERKRKASGALEDESSSKKSKIPYDFRDQCAPVPPSLLSPYTATPINRASPFAQPFPVARAPEPVLGQYPICEEPTQVDINEANKENIPPYLPLFAPHPFNPVLVPVRYERVLDHIPDYQFVNALAPHPADEYGPYVGTAQEDPGFDFNNFIDLNNLTLPPSLASDDQDQSVTVPRTVPLAPQLVVTAAGSSFDDVLADLPSPIPEDPEFDSLFAKDTPTTDVEQLFTTNINKLFTPINNANADNRRFVRAPTPDMTEPFTFNPVDGAILLPRTVLPYPDSLYENHQQCYHCNAAMHCYNCNVAMQDAANPNNFPVDPAFEAAFNDVANNSIQFSEISGSSPPNTLSGGVGELRGRSICGRGPRYIRKLDVSMVPTPITKSMTTDLHDAGSSIHPANRVDSSDQIRKSPSPFDEVFEKEKEAQEARGRFQGASDPVIAQDLAWKDMMLDVRGEAYRQHDDANYRDRYHRRIVDACVREKHARDRSRGRYAEDSISNGGNVQYQFLSTGSDESGSNGGEVEGIIVRTVNNLGIRRQGVWNRKAQEFRVGRGGGQHWKTVDQWKEVLRSGGAGLGKRERKDLGIDHLYASELAEGEFKVLLAARIGDVGNGADEDFNGLFGVGEFRDVGEYAVAADLPDMDFDTAISDLDDEDGSLLSSMASGGYLYMEF